MIGTIVVLWKLPPVYGTLGAAIVLSRMIQGQFDLFWTAVQVSDPLPGGRHLRRRRRPRRDRG